MEIFYYVAYFFAGFFLANSIPHIVAGVLGRAFQSPFAKPPGKGLSSSLVNVLWGYLNLAVGYLLIVHVGAFDVHNMLQVGVAFIGALAISLHLAHHFGQFHGGRL